MKISFRSFQKADFEKVRDFLIRTFENPHTGGNWRLDRWNFAFSFSRFMNFVTLQEFEAQIGIWENERKEIVAVVNSEAENDGEAFFQIGMENLSREVIVSMFRFAERYLFPKDPGKNKTVRIRIDSRYIEFQKVAIERGYKLLDWSDGTSSVKISDWKHKNLADGYFIKSGNQVSDIEKGLAHAYAFGYWENECSKVAALCYEKLKQMPDYREDLDLYVVNTNSKVVAFCTMWYDEVNRFGMLEPVGTHFDYRRKGLGYAVVSEAVKRVRKMGAETIYVGSEQQFYLHMGFRQEFKLNVWEKSLS